MFKHHEQFFRVLLILAGTTALCIWLVNNWPS